MPIKKKNKGVEKHHLFVIKIKYSQCIYVEYQMDMLFWDLLVMGEGE